MTKQQYRSAKSYILIAIVALMASLCLPHNSAAQTAELPVWVDNPSDQFSDQRFLMAVGSATSRQVAKNRARGNLAKIFVSEVEVDEKSVQKYKEITNSKGGQSTTEFQSKTQLITQTDIQSNQQMKNVEIKEVHTAENGTIYALAVMNRMETSQLYTEEINRNKKTIESLRKKAAQTNSKLERLIYVKQALTRARMNEMLINQRAILTGPRSQIGGPSLADITQEYRQAKQECTVRIEGKEIPRVVESAITRQLQNEGFSVVQNGSTPVVTINMNMMIDPVDLDRPNAKFMQWALQVEAQNNENGQWFSTYAAEGREGSMNKKYARKRAIQAARETITSEFPGFINSELLSVR